MDKENRDAKKLSSVPVIIRADNCYAAHINVLMQLENLSSKAVRQWVEWLETSEKRNEKSAGKRMNSQTEEINVDQEEDGGKPVTINAESGSVVIVNVKNYYGHPEWFDRSLFDALIGVLKGKG
jgi:hypothetical protein